jgi:hypothetical protein
MKLPLHEYILAIAEIVALAALIGRLVVSRLVPVYKVFFCYLIFDLLATVWPFFVPFNNLYWPIYMSSQAIRLCLYVLIIFELYSVLLRDLKGIARRAKRYSVVALAISAMLSVFVVTALPLPHSLLRKLFYVEIPIISVLVLFIGLIAVFLAYYPVVLHRNALAYATGYIVYFVCKTTLMFLYNLHLGASGRVFSTILLYVTLGCIVFWAILFNRAGEQSLLSVGSRWSPAERQQQVLRHLRELNDILQQTRPK